MTPEQIEEIKYMLSMTKEQCESFVDAGEYSDQDFIDLYAASKELLAALEESKQDESRLQTAIDWWDNYSRDKSEELAEAQQTIARQQKVIDWYESGGSMGELVEEGSDKA
ncbi:hypothetical protein MHI32_01495 [Paenibacillus sp. FSL H7-0690]|uniref:hypothetical protein n=1 Tax=Paenibacillus sp. FSL H7-0690 TaxID=2921437 RepID=UPI0030EE79DA